MPRWRAEPPRSLNLAIDLLYVNCIHQAASDLLTVMILWEAAWNSLLLWKIQILKKLIRQFLQSLPSTSENSGTEGEAICGQSYFEYDGHRISDCDKQRAEARLARSTLAKRLLGNLESSLSSYEMLGYLTVYFLLCRLFFARQLTSSSVSWQQCVRTIIPNCVSNRFWLCHNITTDRLQELLSNFQIHRQELSHIRSSEVIW